MIECGSVSPHEHHNGATCNWKQGHVLPYHAETDYYGSMRFWTERDLIKADYEKRVHGLADKILTVVGFGMGDKIQTIQGLAEEVNRARDRIPPE